MYTLVMDSRAESDLERLSPPIAQRIRKRLEKLCQNPDNEHHKALKGKYKGKFSLKIAKHYRIIYSFNKSIREVTVHQIGHRSKVY